MPQIGTNITTGDSYQSEFIQDVAERESDLFISRFGSWGENFSQENNFSLFIDFCKKNKDFFLEVSQSNCPLRQMNLEMFQNIQEKDFIQKGDMDSDNEQSSTRTMKPEIF